MPFKEHSIDALPLAKPWIKQCIDQHVECRGLNSSTFELPTRVIDVGPAHGSEAPRLMESAGQIGDWIALSHCWGTEKFLKQPLKIK